MEQPKKFILDNWFIKTLIFIGILFFYYFMILIILNILNKDKPPLFLASWYIPYWFPPCDPSPRQGMIVECTMVMPHTNWLLIILVIIGSVLLTFFTYRWIYKKIHQRRDSGTTNQTKGGNMAKENNTKTIWIIIAVILGILIIGGLIFGFSLYYYYRNGTNEKSSSSQVAEIRDLTSYNNARYGFSFSYPKTFTKTESQNSDGVTLTTNDPPMTIRVYGSMNALSQNLDDYLNESRKYLFQEQGNGEEILAESTTLGGAPALQRQWKYKNSVDSLETIVDQVSVLKDEAFYTVQMVVGSSDYDEYPAHVFDQILQTFKFSP